MIIGSELGIGYDPDQHAAYAASWIQILENQPLEIFRAAADGEKIHTGRIGMMHTSSSVTARR
jgi:putative DNA primase/helicase